MEKKEKIKALETHFRTKAVYLGAPTFAYEIKTPEGTYIVDRTGVIRDSKRNEIDIDTILNATPDDTDGLQIKFSFEGHTGNTLQNIVNMLSSRQKLIVRAFGSETPLIDESFTEDLNRWDISTTQNLKEAFFAAGPEKCPGLRFDFEKETFTIRLMTADPNPNPDQITAFAKLAALINEYAKTLKTTSFRPVQDDNPKYAFRTWLTRLGMKGNEYKDTRKTLLAELEGNGAFRRLREESRVS